MDFVASGGSELASLLHTRVFCNCFIVVQGRQYHLNRVSRHDILGFHEIEGHGFFVARMHTVEVSLHDCEHMHVR
jgi:hypothetical protein